MPAQTTAHINICSLCSFENVLKGAVYLIFFSSGAQSVIHVFRRASFCFRWGDNHFCADLFLWIVFDQSPLFCKHTGVGQNNVNTWEIGNISLLRIFWPSLKRCNLWIVSRVSSIKTSSSCFRDVEGRNQLLTLLTKTVHSGLIIFKSGKSSGQGRCWSSFWGSNCPGFMTATPLIKIRAISALSWMLIFVKFSACFKQKYYFSFSVSKFKVLLTFLEYFIIIY